jgi:DNA-binding FadR family transcriptional regulator
MQFLARENGDGERLPSLAELSQRLGVSIAKVREQLEVARALGLVEVRPKTGIRRRPYTFTPAVCKSLSYAAQVDAGRHFAAFSDLRSHIEAAYWRQAVRLLNETDHIRLRELLKAAEDKLNGHPIQIPHGEHRELHLLIYRRLENPFVTGILEAYWEAYEAFGLNLYADIAYLKTVWDYHRRMVDAIAAGDADGGYRLLIEHTNLLTQRELADPRAAPPRMGFE